MQVAGTGVRCGRRRVSTTRSGASIRAVAEPVVEESFDVALLGHAGRPSLTVVRASASRAARMARWA